MDIRKLQRAIVDGLEDVKAQNIVVFNTEHLSPLFERVIIASGTSNRQTKSLAASVRDAVKGAGLPLPRTEGEVNGEWIIVDCGAAVVHVMQPTIREYYQVLDDVLRVVEGEIELLGIVVADLDHQLVARRLGRHRRLLGNRFLGDRGGCPWLCGNRRLCGRPLKE